MVHEDYDSAIQLTGNEMLIHIKAIDKDSVEFIAFALYKLWYGLPRRFSHNQYVPFMVKTNAPEKRGDATLFNVVSPLDCEAWYPNLVARLYDFLKRGEFDVPLILMALLYVGRLRHLIKANDQDPEIALFHLFVGSIIVTQKCMSDYRYSCSMWSVMTGYAADDIRYIERFYLASIRWKLYTTEEQYSKWVGIIHTLAKEHKIVLKAVGTPDKHLNSFIGRYLGDREDLIAEVKQLRKRDGA
jgi:hypothetical protein